MNSDSAPNIMNQLIQYEQNRLTIEETKQLFQKLVDTGLAWKLQGHYGRRAEAMLEEGMICLDQQ